jgi:hypothetical protein
MRSGDLGIGLADEREVPIPELGRDQQARGCVAGLIGFAGSRFAAQHETKDVSAIGHFI